MLLKERCKEIENDSFRMKGTRLSNERDKEYLQLSNFIAEVLNSLCAAFLGHIAHLKKKNMMTTAKKLKDKCEF